MSIFIVKTTTSYHFITHWRVEATCQEVYTILKASDDLPRWWPAVYLDVQTQEKGDAAGIGKVIALHTKGWLPYTLKWQSRVTAVNPYSGFSLEAFGDLTGRGIWTFEQEGAYCNITYDWRIKAEKPILKYLSFSLKPIFAANHHWAMDKGLASLQLELRRCKGEINVPPPPPPTFPHNIYRKTKLNAISTT
jgi:hypothetical protein